MSASALRLNLAITVGPEKPDDIETILSGPWPILVDYPCNHEWPTDISLERMHSALEHHDRVRGIHLNGERCWFKDFFKATSCPFPALEILYLRYRSWDLEIPDTFLGGPDLSNLRLRSLTLRNVPLTPISGLLSFATSLTDLHLELSDSSSPSVGTSLVASLQGMHCLHKLDLRFSLFSSPSQPPIPKEVVPLAKLTNFRYHGSSSFLYALVAGISAPALCEVHLEFRGAIESPIVHLPRFIDEIGQQYQTVLVNIDDRVGSWTYSIWLGFRNPGLYLESYDDPRRYPESMMQIIGAISPKLSTVKKLRISFYDCKHPDYDWEDYLPWRMFYRHLSSVKTIRISYSMARTLYQDHGEPDLFVLPALEEIYFCKRETVIDESERGTFLAAFQPFLTAREQAGRPVNVFFSSDLP